MEKPLILLVEDEPNFGIVLKSFLELNGFEVKLCNNGKSGLETFKLYSFDLCILDVMMPQMDGLTLGSEIRKLNTEVPYIFLTAKGQKEDILEGYKRGADDYITKPFDTDVLLVKIKAILKRQLQVQEAEEDKLETIKIGSFDFSPEKRTLTNSQESFSLSPKEADLLRLLCKNKDHVVSREAALKKVWGSANYFNGRSMDVYLTKLRKYLKADTSIKITNIHGNGFCLQIEAENTVNV